MKIINRGNSAFEVLRMNISSFLYILFCKSTLILEQVLFT